MLTITGDCVWVSAVAPQTSYVHRDNSCNAPTFYVETFVDAVMYATIIIIIHA